VEPTISEKWDLAEGETNVNKDLGGKKGRSLLL
jgi:hypothetical protein